jgi:hypothetical protein
MTLLSRLIANALLPLFLLCGGYLLLYQLGEGLLGEMSLQASAIGLSALLAALPPIAFNFIIRSQLKEGFALLKNGKVVLPNEITLTHVLGNQITAWKLFKQHLDTEVCLQGKNELVYVQLGLDFQIPANERGKRFIKHFKNNMTVFEVWVQRAIFLASMMDRELAHSLANHIMMNEEDERTLRSKFLSALEMQPLKSIELPVNTAGLSVNPKVRVRKKITPVQPSALHLEDDLGLDDDLLNQLGLN